ncbi:MAG: hypothetical protein O9246_00095 [Brevundimonas sp.]|nr:hypothetical protein [Brevundimonas sp.]
MAGVGIMIAGCADSIQIQTQLYLGAPKAKRKEFFDGYVTQFANDDGAWYDLIGDDWMFLSAEDRAEAIKDQDTFLKTALGAHLAQKNYRYEDMPENARAEFPREVFDYYKGHGQAWLKARVDLPRNAGLKARRELYYRRMNRVDHFAKPSSLRALLLDDASFTKFLTDNNYAALWIMQNVDDDRNNSSQPYPDIRHLGPTLTGILPGLAS